MNKQYKIIAFDADDTLWINEPYYQEAEKQLAALLSKYIDEEDLTKELYKTEKQNLHIYGFGAKGFMLSMIETALRVSRFKISQKFIDQIINTGKELLNKPIVLLPGVQGVLDYLFNRGVKMILATKGDLLDQERKLELSGLKRYFHHIEIMSDKKETDYKKLISHLNIRANEFLMIGNSMKSDIEPVINIGASAIHVPYKTTWIHESTGRPIDQDLYYKVEQISQIIRLIDV